MFGMAVDSRPMPHAMLRILLALAAGERHGYAIMQELKTDGLGGPLGTGTLYRAIQQLLDEGLIAESSGAAQESTDERRRYFRLSPAGRRALGVETARLAHVLKRAAAIGIVTPGRR
jgi:DNA-binding PadR family transcriptional regulator